MQKLKQYMHDKPRLYAIFQPLLIRYRRTLMDLARRRHGVDPRKAVFSSFDFRSYNDNPRVISEKLHEMAPDFRIIWLVRDPKAMKSVVPSYVTLRQAISRQAFRDMATARFWVDNFSKRPYLTFVRGEQYYINTWHGDRPFKRIVYDTTPPSEYRLEEDASLLVSGSDYGDRMYRSAFHYKGEILSDGMPRNDCLVNATEEDRLRIRRKLNVPDDVSLLLFAPTFRLINLDTDNRQNVGLDVPRVLDRLEERTGKKWLCLYRTHYFMPGLNLKTAADRMLDVTKYPEMADLLLASDVLLTDYSSCAGDYALLRRPILLYQDDKQDYAAHDRGLYFDPADSPFMTANDPDELDRLILSLDFDKAAENCDAVNEFFGSHESGRSAESVCRWILDRAGGD